MPNTAVSLPNIAMPQHMPLTAPPFSGAGFVTSWPVRSGDADRRNRLRLDGVARYLQDIAWDSVHAVSFADHDPTWILRRTIIDVIEPVIWPGVATLQRWCGGFSTFWANMRVSITSPAGGKIETEGFWINVNEKTGRPARISESGRAHLGTTTTETRLRWQAWLTETPPPASAADLAFPVRATDVDQYQHVNNAVYWQAAEHYLAQYPALAARPHRAVIEYNSPVKPQAHMIIRSRYADGTLYLWFVVDNLVTTHVRIGPVP